MDIDKITDAWYWSRWHGEGDGHGEYLATSSSAISIHNDDCDLDARQGRPETTC